MNKEEWKQTAAYKEGEFHLRFGKLLQNPRSRISDFAKLGNDYGMKMQIVWRDPVEEPVQEVEE